MNKKRGLKKILSRDKKAAMELSIGTIVILVLAMTMLVLGIILVRSIFSSAEGAISGIDSGVKNEIQKIFSTEGKKIALYPTAGKIRINQGTNDEGFAFSIKNNDIDSAEFEYTVKADPNFDYNKCGSNFRAEYADDWVLVKSGSFPLGPGASLENPELVLFDIPENAPPCTVGYRVDVTKEGQTYAYAKIYLTVK